jgi:hypothetical protein
LGVGNRQVELQQQVRRGSTRRSTKGELQLGGKSKYSRSSSETEGNQGIWRRPTFELGTDRLMCTQERTGGRDRHGPLHDASGQMARRRRGWEGGRRQRQHGDRQTAALREPEAQGCG